MSSFSRTISSSNEKLNQNESKPNQSDKKSLNPSLNQSTSSNLNPSINPSINPSLNQNLSGSLNRFNPKMSISPSLSSNQSSAASSVNSLIDNQEELTNLTNYVKHFREQLGKLRRIISNEISQRKDDHRQKDEDESSLFSKDSKDSSIKDLSNKELLAKDTLSTGGINHRESPSRELSRDLSKDSTKELIDRQEMFKAQLHDKLADVLRVLRLIFERFAEVQSPNLVMCSKSLIESVRAFPSNDQSTNLNDLLDKIDQLAVSFSNRVSEYLMEGDCLSAQPKAKSSASFDCSTNQSVKYVCDSNNNQQTLTPNFPANSSDNSDFLWNSVYNMFVPFHRRVFSSDTTNSKKEDATNWDNTQAHLSSDECDEIIQRMNQSVEFALQNAKLWSKYTKDIMIYIEKRISIQMENSKNFLKLAQTMKPILKESDNLPLQQMYLNMIDLDIKNHKAYFANLGMLNGHKFIEPLTILRNENEKCRKSCKNQWNREYKKLLDSVNNLKKARSTYIAKRIELDRCKQALKTVLESGSITSPFGLTSSVSSSNQPTSSNQSSTSFMQSTNFGQQLNHIQMETSSEQIKLDKKRKLEEEATIKAYESENTYRTAVTDANERARTCENIKKTILNRIKDLDYKSDLTLTSVTSNYLQIQKLVTSAEPVDFQQLLKEIESYPLGSNLSDYLTKLRDSNQKILNCFTFIPFETSSDPSSMSFERNLDYEMHQAESMDLECLNPSTSGSLENRTTNQGNLTGEEQEQSEVSSLKRDSLVEQQQQQHQISSSSKKKSYRKTKVALSHHFRTVRTLNKCKECDNVNFNFQGLECTQCGICVHKKCIETLTILCGMKPLNKRTNIFQLDLCNQSVNNEVPYLVTKCIQEINRRGLGINGLYRVSGVKSQVEKLCSDFELGGQLVELSGVSPTVLSSLLKFYFRSIPEPLLTYRLYGDFIQVGKRYPNIKSETTGDDLNTSSSQALLKELRHTVNKLPEVHLNTLDYLMKHLKKVSENPNINMPANNLGIVFGPTLLRANEGATSLSTLVDTVHQNRVIELLIIYYNELFAGNLVQDDNDGIEQEFDEIIDSLKTVAMDEEEDEEDDNNEETQLDNLIHDLNKSELLPKEYASAASRSSGKHHLQSRDYSTEGYYSGYLKNQDSVDKGGECSSKLSSKFNAPRTSLHELRKQFFTSETASTTSPFQSFGPTDELTTSEKRPFTRNPTDSKFESSSNQFFSERLASESSRSSSTTKLTSIPNQPKQQSSNQQLSQSKSPLFKSKDDREPKYV